MLKGLNFCLFQLVWFSSVLGAAYGMPWLALISLSVFIGVHSRVSHCFLLDIQLAAICLVCGALLDSLWGALHWVEFIGYQIRPLAPYWLLCLWVAFAFTINHSMSWMKANIGLAAVSGLFFGPLSYYAGERMGAMVWLQPVYAIAGLGIAWAFLMPTILIAAKLLSDRDQNNSACQELQ